MKNQAYEVGLSDGCQIVQLIDAKRSYYGLVRRSVLSSRVKYGLPALVVDFVRSAKKGDILSCIEDDVPPFFFSGFRIENKTHKVSFVWYTSDVREVRIKEMWRWSDGRIDEAIISFFTRSGTEYELRIMGEDTTGNKLHFCGGSFANYYSQWVTEQKALLCLCKHTDYRLVYDDDFYNRLDEWYIK